MQKAGKHGAVSFTADPQGDGPADSQAGFLYLQVSAELLGGWKDTAPQRSQKAPVSCRLHTSIEECPAQPQRGEKVQCSG